MFGRVLTVGIVAFWLVMMTLLIRSEFLDNSPLAYSIPVDTVMQKIFEGEEPSDLVIDYQGNRVGRCTLQVVKLGAQKPGYLVTSELRLDFEVFGKGVSLQSRTDSEFDTAHQMTKFFSRTTTGDTKLEASGDMESKEIQLTLNLGDVKETHKLPFSMLENMGPSGAMGLFGMGGLQLPQDATTSKPALGALNPGTRGAVTTVEEKHLTIGRIRERTWMVHTKYDDSLWSKVYVNRVGEILKVETSFGVTMLNAQFAQLEAR